MSLDTFLLSKETKVFVLHEGTTAERMVDSHRIMQTVNSFEQYGFKCNLQSYPSSDKIIEDPELHYGIKRLPLDLDKLDTLEIKQWYGFLNVARKARILDRGFIITFAGNVLVKDLNRFPVPTLFSNPPVMYKWPSSKTNPSICRNYFLYPGTVDTLLEQWVYNLSFFNVDIHYFFKQLPVCYTLNADLKVPAL